MNSLQAALLLVWGYMLFYGWLAVSGSPDVFDVWVLAQLMSIVYVQGADHVIGWTHYRLGSEIVAHCHVGVRTGRCPSGPRLYYSWLQKFWPEHKAGV